MLRIGRIVGVAGAGLVTISLGAAACSLAVDYSAFDSKYGADAASDSAPQDAASDSAPQDLACADAGGPTQCQMCCNGHYATGVQKKADLVQICDCRPERCGAICDDGGASYCQGGSPTTECQACGNMVNQRTGDAGCLDEVNAACQSDTFCRSYTACTALCPM